MSKTLTFEISEELYEAFDHIAASTTDRHFEQEGFVRLLKP